MSDKAEHIDQFFKENIEQVNVQYNPAHWDRLQKAMVVGAAAGVATVVAVSKWQAILKFLKLYKIYVTIVSVAAVTTTTGVIYFSTKNKEPQKNNDVIITNDSIGKPPLKIDEYTIDSDTPVPVNKNFYFKPNITTLSDTPKYINPYSIDTTRKVLLPKKDTISSVKKDTVKKKNLNTFW